MKVKHFMQEQNIDPSYLPLRYNEVIKSDTLFILYIYIYIAARSNRENTARKALFNTAYIHLV